MILKPGLRRVSLQITKPFFSAVGDEKLQQKLLSVMFDLLVDSRSPLVSNTISSVFKGVRQNPSERGQSGRVQSGDVSLSVLTDRR